VAFLETVTLGGDCAQEAANPFNALGVWSALPALMKTTQLYMYQVQIMRIFPPGDVFFGLLMMITLFRKTYVICDLNLGLAFKFNET
jgi:hypothetical protein